MKRAPLALLLVIAVAAAVWFFSSRPPAPPPAVGTRVAFQTIPSGLDAAFSGKTAYDHVQAIVDIGPRPTGSEGYEKSLVYLEAEFAKCGWTTRRQSFSKSGAVTFTNLLARHSSGQSDWTRSTPVVIGGHLDSKAMTAFKFVGANDGGSSTGVILELARVLSSTLPAASQVEFVLFDGEEAFQENITPTDGLYGSKRYAHELSKRATWPSLGIVLDLVGDPKHGFYYNADATPSVGSAVEKAATAAGLALSRSPGPILDDHVPLQGTGLNCLHLIGDFMNMPYWHKQGDTMEVIDAGALEKAGRTTLRFLAEVKP